jgi:hypothetical protein
MTGRTSGSSSFLRLSAIAAVAVVIGAATIASGTTVAHAAPPGSISVTPSQPFYLTPGQAVHVTGTGWEPNASVVVWSCTFPAPNYCTGTGGALVAVDASGSFSADVVPQRSFLAKGGTYVADCEIGCVVAAMTSDLQYNAFGYGFLAPPPPSIVPGVGSVPEGGSGTSSLQVPVTLSRVMDYTVTASWKTVTGAGAANEADPSTDYTPTTGTVTFPPGTTSASATIPIRGDALVEPDEPIVVAFGSSTLATIGGYLGLGFGIIVNDDTTTLVPGSTSITEGTSGTRNIQVPVTLTNPSTQTVTADWATIAGASTPGWAEPGTDYTAATGTVTFAPGETAKTVSISVKGDTLVEPDELVIASFTAPTNAKLGGYLGLGFGIIVNDDT